MIKCSAFLIMLTMLFGCTHSTINVDKSELSPFGTYTAIINHADNSTQNFKLQINENSTYQLCLKEKCEVAKLEKVPANYGLILVNFYQLKNGAALERASFARPVSDAFYQKIAAIRLTQPRAHDLAFNLTYCDNTPCFRLGHSRRGVIFIKSQTAPLKIQH